MPISISDLIAEARREITAANQNGAKAGYIVDELTIELHVGVEVNAGAGLQFSILGVGVGGNAQGQHAQGHKIILKLKPKKLLRPRSTSPPGVQVESIGR